MKKSKRYFSEMGEMFELPDELYTMKRGVKRKGKMRYDITIIPNLIINNHFNKTQGHIHSTGHEELYQVIKGEALFQFQKGKKSQLIYASKGEKVLVPGDVYHNTTNIGSGDLVLSNWIDDDCVSDYTYIKDKKGMLYYIKTTGIIKNPNYK